MFRALNVTALAALFCALSPASAVADVFGAWSGKLAYSDSSGRMADWDCLVEITRTPDTLFVADRNWCTYMHRELAIENGQLFLAGRVVGTISDTKIELREERAEYFYQFTADLSEAGELRVSDIFHDWAANHSEKVSGGLKLAR